MNKNEPEKKETFFALQIDLDRVKSAIWTVEGDQSRVLSLGEVVSWAKEEELLEAVDSSLSSAVEKLASAEETLPPQKIIFGLSSDWVSENKISPEKTEILKKISQKLELKPLGFVVIPEAIAHWLKKQEGVPPNAVLVGLSPKKISVSLMEVGRVLESNLVVRSENLGADLTEGLSRFTKEGPFPARVLLYDHEEKLEEARQELINWPWQEEKINFLHLPKIEILAADFDIKSIVLASASQVAEVKGLEEISPTAPVVTAPVMTGKEPVDQPAETLEEEPLAETKPVQPPVRPEAVWGFVKDQDITEVKAETLQETEAEEETIAPEEKPQKEPFLKKPDFVFLKEKLSWGKAAGKIHWPSLAFLKGLTAKRGLPIFLLTGLVLLTLLGGLGALYWFLPRAQITLKVKPQALERDFVVELDPSLTSVDKENLVLPAKEIEALIEDSKEKATTGVKLVGEKAKGKVTIYNRTSKERTFASGTEIAGPNDLVFTLNGSVTVASESAGSDYVKIPGKAEVEVTAVEIGSEGNLASGSEFTIGNLAKSDFVAKNESSFAEGSSREIQAVDKADQDQLLTDLLKELEQKAIEQLQGKLSLGQKLIEASLATEVEQKVFDQKVGEEANKVSLSLKIKATALIFNETEFKQLAEEEIRDLVPSDFDYDPGKTEISFEPQKTSKKDVFSFKAFFKADLTPKLDLAAVKRNLLGKKPAIGKTYLSNLPHVVSFEAQIRPRLPESLVTFPRVLNRIKIEVKLE
ncbi:hypothetical protein FJZ41_00105 [Candidatus Shapirobacteria bacterium]|nr:hypothetical protein [Candidatus Shapirobacteria bacterium]